MSLPRSPELLQVKSRVRGFTFLYGEGVIRNSCIIWLINFNLCKATQLETTVFFSLQHSGTS